MKKLICDVCGTAYPENADQCPICGCANPVDTGEAADAEGGAGGTSYSYVKGGRFSKRNVKKRNKAARRIDSDELGEDEEYYVEPERSSAKGLVIAAVVLLLAIVAVIIYIVGFLLGGKDSGQPKDTTGPSQTQTQTTAATTAATTIPTTESLDHSCTGLTLESDNIKLTAVGQTIALNAVAQPLDTTDPISYASSNTEIATVSDDGVVTAVAAGEAEITVTCGEFTAVCKVTCEIEEETTEPTETVKKGNYVMVSSTTGTVRGNKHDVTLKKNESFSLMIKDQDTGEILEVTWVSDNENVCVVDGNKLTAVASSGSAIVSCTVGDTTFSCTVRGS